MSRRRARAALHGNTGAARPAASTKRAIAGRSSTSALKPLGIRGRSSMNKETLARDIASKQK
jgi:hypothetical protein